MSFCAYYEYVEGYESIYDIVWQFCKREEQYEAPMPWIGFYVAAASLVCTLAMAADVFHGFRHRTLWFPSKFFTLNAAYLTLLAVATKLSVDLSTEMPTGIDQLVKLSSTALMSTAIGNFMPSLGAMGDTQILMNITALAILIITVAVNICIQLRTQVIDLFLEIENAAAVSFMLVLLVISSFSALMVSTTKNCLQLNYDDGHKRISSEESEETKNFSIEKLKVNVKKYWMMANSGSPQFVMARSVTCYASGAICLLVAFTLGEAHIRIFIYCKECMNPRNVRSSYRWSTFVILVIQSFGVVAGTIAPTFRWFTAIRLNYSARRFKNFKTELKTEYYWCERLVGWKESPLAFRVQNQKWRKLVHKTKNLILDICIKVVIVIVLASKLIKLISFVLISPFVFFENKYKLLKQKLISNHTASSNHTGMSESELCDYVLYLEGEEGLPLRIMENNRDATHYFIQKGEKQQPKHLKELLEKSVDFMGVARFDSDEVPNCWSHFEKLPNCWSLPVVTLTSIAIALPDVENHKVKGLLQSVSEGLVYVNLVEKLLNAKSEMVDIRDAAVRVWLRVDLFRKWLDEDLQKMALEVKTAKETLERLADRAKIIVTKFKAKMNGNQNEIPSSWHMKTIAANSMYRISQTVLLDLEGCNNQTDGVFGQLSVMIADILSACLTNLPRVITMKCFCGAIEEREMGVEHAAQLLGETEEILKILQHRELPHLNHDKVAYIDEWCALIKQNSTCSFNDGTSSGSGELHITVG